MKTAIIGFGWVGKAMYSLFPESIIYDPSARGDASATKEEVNQCDIAFIGVPTPCPVENRLDTSIVEEVISWCECDLIVIRSTVNPGDCDYWSKKYGKNIVMQPEYLGETPDHPMLKMKDRPFHVLGGAKENTEKLIQLYSTVYNANTIFREVSLLEAEVIKLSENRAIAFKVAECQELYDACKLAGINYNTIREIVYGVDPRFNLWWTLVFENKRGFNSKCIPKDVYAWCAWAESLGYVPTITWQLLAKNKEWLALNA